MDIKKDLSPNPSKYSLFQRIVGFTKSDENYQIENKEIKKITREKQPWSSWKNIKAAFLVLTVFYLLLCAFILLNPSFSLFFNNVFKIEYVTVQFILEYTIYIFYSLFGIFLGATFLFFWYRSIVIRTRKKYKKIILWCVTFIFGGLFFTNIALFAWTYTYFLSLDFTNMDERVVLYDNELLGYKKQLKDKQMPFFKIPQKAIWPLNIRFDISPQIKKIVRENGILLNRGYSFEIDYNGDGDPDTGSGDNPNVHLAINNPESSVLVPQKFEKTGTYKTTALIRAMDAAGNKKEINIEMPDILIQNVVDVSKTEGKDWAKIYIFDASSLSNLGQAQWSIIDQVGTEFTGYQYSPKNIAKYPAIVCLKMQPMDLGTTDPCDWRYVIDENIQSNITNTDIIVKTDPINPLKYQFSLDPRVLQGEMKTIRWRIDGRLYDGKFDSGTEKIFDYTFKNSGTYLLDAEIEDTLGNRVTTQKKSIFTTLFTELKSGYNLQIFDENDIEISKNRYTINTKTYSLPDVPVPWSLTLDAVGIQSLNPRLKLVKAEWDLDNDGVYEKTGFRIQHELYYPQQYTLYARYTFEDKTVDGKIQNQIYIDKVIVKWVEKSIDVRVKIIPDHDYAPALVRFDATGSRIQKGEILKFLYDFWDGSKIYEWEGIVEYRYQNPGEYKIHITAVTKDGRKESIERVLIIKKPQESVSIVPSVASENAQAGFPITFEILSQWTVESISWNFGDNTSIIEGMSAVHTFPTAGTYTIVARAIYESGIEKTATILYQVK